MGVATNGCTRPTFVEEGYNDGELVTFAGCFLFAEVTVIPSLTRIPTLPWICQIVAKSISTTRLPHLQ